MVGLGPEVVARSSRIRGLSSLPAQLWMLVLTQGTVSGYLLCAMPLVGGRGQCGGGGKARDVLTKMQKAREFWVHWPSI